MAARPDPDGRLSAAAVTNHLAPFDPDHAPTILAWVQSPNELEAWASLGPPGPGPDVFDEWQSDPDVHPFLLLVDDEVGGYGEVWEDPADDEAELARIVIAPELRGRGIGRAFVRLLAERAQERGFDHIWLRVLPTNAAALACYRGAGFVPATLDQEAEFNRGQPNPYVWMQLLRPSENAVSR